MNVWKESQFPYLRVAVPDDGKPETAARMIRDALIKDSEIGKFSPVTVELVSAGAVNVYREVWN